MRPADHEPDVVAPAPWRPPVIVDPPWHPRLPPPCPPWDPGFPFDRARAARDAARDLADSLDTVRRRVSDGHDTVARDRPEGMFATRFADQASELEGRLARAAETLRRQAEAIDGDIKRAGWPRVVAFTSDERAR